MLKIDIDKKLHGSKGEMSLNVNLEIEEGDFVALSGKSGSGKTTILRILAGLESSNGTITIGDEIWQNRDFNLSVQRRKIGFIFQDYALFPNMSVEQNLLFVEKDRELANYLLEITELSSLKKRLPLTLSGGQKQRLALCRAFMNRPKLLLMDEPLSALDPYMRSKLQKEILRLHKEFKTTTIMVSHEPAEIYRLASRVLVLEQGEIVDDVNVKDFLTKTSDSQKLSFEGELLEILKVDSNYVAIVAIGQQLVEVAISKEEAESLVIGDSLNLSTKSISVNIF